MSRKSSITKSKKPTVVHPIYEDKIISKLINNIMKDGKKEIAENILFNTLDNLNKRKNADPLKLLHNAINNIRPIVQIKNIRMGGSTYKVPIEITPDKQIGIAVKWLIDSFRSRSERSAELRLTNEILDILNKQGRSIKRKEDLHKLAEANRAFSHFRW